MDLIDKNPNYNPYGYCTGYSFFVWFDLLNYAYEDAENPASEVFLN